MKITELSGKAYRRALAAERREEWDGKRTYDGEPITEEVLVSYSILSGAEYDENGDFIGYFIRKDTITEQAFNQGGMRMTIKAIARQINRIQTEGFPTACIGCGNEHNCSLHGCAVLNAAIEKLQEKNDAEA